MKIGYLCTENDNTARSDLCWGEKTGSKTTWLDIGLVEEHFHLLSLSPAVLNEDPGEIGNPLESLGKPGQVGHLGGSGVGRGDHVQHRQAHYCRCALLCQLLMGVFLQTPWNADPECCVNHYDESSKFDGVRREKWHSGLLFENNTTATASAAKLKLLTPVLSLKSNTQEQVAQWWWLQRWQWYECLLKSCVGYFPSRGHKIHPALTLVIDHWSSLDQNNPLNCAVKFPYKYTLLGIGTEAHLL